MLYVRQAGIIFLISFLGELLNYFIPLPIPASIYGFLLMLLALKLKIVKLHQVWQTAEFLLDIMALMFIPAAVGLLKVWGIMREMLVPIIVVIFVTTVLVMAVTGRVTQRIIRSEKGKTE
ncbi:MAG: CidA/LrgA family protein [Clostridiaceae bacterium]|nr:CidA/LrgA family protein [Clostridiaceae bacterium]